MARPTKLTPELRDRIAALVRAGAYVEGAVRACGLGIRTHYEWMRRDDDYRQAIESARAEAEVQRVATIALAAPAGWRAAAWFLGATVCWREHASGKGPA